MLDDYTRDDQREEKKGRTGVYEPVAIDIVVERELLVLLDIAFGKYTHSNMSPNSPLGNIAIRIAAVVCKTSDSTALCRVYELQDDT